MPEALAIVAVFVIAVIIYIGLWMQTRDPARYQPHEEIARMEQQMKWLDERVGTARREKWGAEMVESIAAEREATAGQLAAARAKATTTVAAAPAAVVAAGR